MPYIDKMRFQMLADQEAAILRGIAGEVDLAERNFQVLENLPMLKASEADGNYELRVGIGDNFTTGNEIWLNYDLKDEGYGQLREHIELVQEQNFRTYGVRNVWRQLHRHGRRWPNTRRHG